MRLSISNMAWDPAQDEAVVEILQSSGIDAIDICPGKYFPNPHDVAFEEITAVRKWWESRGIEIVGMHALLQGAGNHNLYLGESHKAHLLSWLDRVCRIGEVLGATRLTLGSPRSRDHGTRPLSDSLEIAADFLHRLGCIADEHGVIVCVDPVPETCSHNPITNSMLAGAVARMSGHDNIKMQLDTGAASLVGEDLDSVLRVQGRHVGHIHISEPYLVPIGHGVVNHPEMAGHIARWLPGLLGTVVMGTNPLTRLNDIAFALAFASQHYRKPA